MIEGGVKLDDLIKTWSQLKNVLEIDLLLYKKSAIVIDILRFLLTSRCNSSGRSH